MSRTYLFTYGTLRPGGALDDITPGEHIGTASMPGQLYRHQSARFPVCCDPDTRAVDQLVTGDLFMVADPKRLDFIIDMECGAGYDARIRKVIWHRSRMAIPALAFTWPDRLPVGPRIWCGDWFSDEAREVCADIGDTAGFTHRR